MRRLAVVVLLIAACVPVRLATSATTATPGFDYGVAAGEITSTSAILWTRAPRPGPLIVGITGVSGEGIDGRVSARAADDLTVRFPARALRASTPRSAF